ncbi:hypothetical protein MBANPS3_010890, partial [Mucor bainieri]
TQIVEKVSFSKTRLRAKHECEFRSKTYSEEAKKENGEDYVNPLEKWFTKSTDKQPTLHLPPVRPSGSFKE